MDYCSSYFKGSIFVGVSYGEILVLRPAAYKNKLVLLGNNGSSNRRSIKIYKPTKTH